MDSEVNILVSLTSHDLANLFMLYHTVITTGFYTVSHGKFKFKMIENTLDIQTSFDHVMIPTRGNWFKNNPLNHESEDRAGMIWGVSHWHGIRICACLLGRFFAKFGIAMVSRDEGAQITKIGCILGKLL